MITKQELLDKIEQANSNDEYLRIVRKYIIHGIPYVFKDNANRYYDFREQIANHWHVGFQEVLILGSGKLGYSYHKNSVFSDESDIDVAIVNQSLFESFYLEIRNFQYRLESGLETLTSHEKCEYNRFLSYMIKGWMRPDILPAKLRVSYLKMNGSPILSQYLIIIILQVTIKFLQGCLRTLTIWNTIIQTQ